LINSKLAHLSVKLKSEVVVELDFPDVEYSEKEKKIIQLSAKTCPVFQSLHPDLKKTFIFNFT